MSVMRYDSLKLECILGILWEREMVTSGLHMTSLMECRMLDVVRMLLARASQNAKAHGKQCNGIGDMTLQSGQNFGT